jgi:twinkle protein
VSHAAQLGFPISRTQATLERNAVRQESNVWSPAANEKVTAAAFPYYRNGKLVNIKYRGPNKTFWQVKGAEKILYGLDDIVNQDWIIIVEGELDKLALEEAGFQNVVSVPDGAPVKVHTTRRL